MRGRGNGVKCAVAVTTSAPRSVFFVLSAYRRNRRNTLAVRGRRLQRPQNEQIGGRVLSRRAASCAFAQPLRGIFPNPFIQSTPNRFRPLHLIAQKTYRFATAEPKGDEKGEMRIARCDYLALATILRSASFGRGVHCLSWQPGYSPVESIELVGLKSRIYAPNEIGNRKINKSNHCSSQRVLPEVASC